MAGGQRSRSLFGAQGFYGGKTGFDGLLRICRAKVKKKASKQQTLFHISYFILLIRRKQGSKGPVRRRPGGHTVISSILVDPAGKPGQLPLLAGLHVVEVVFLRGFPFVGKIDGKDGVVSVPSQAVGGEKQKLGLRILLQGCFQFLAGRAGAAAFGAQCPSQRVQ